MLNITIFDDNKKICENLRNNIKSYFENLKEEVIINTFSSSKDFLAYFNKNKNLDILFLDIEIDEFSGINIADIIRNQFEDDYCKIIFISAHQSYAMSLFKLRPTDFLIKPITTQNLYQCLDMVLNIINRDRKIFKYKIRSEIFSEPLKNIILFESMGRKIKIYTKKNETTFYGCLKDICKDLEKFNFIQTHNSFLINSSFISKVCKTEVILTTGMSIPISRANKDRILSLYLNDAH